MKNVNRISKIFILILLISTAFAQSGRDLTGTEVSAVAFSVEGESHTAIEFNVSVVSPDFNWADGVRFTFDQSVNIIDAFVATELDTPAAVIIAGNEVMFGDSSDGVFDGDGIFLNDNEYVFVVHVDGYLQAPINISYTVYDDGWAQDFCINEDHCEQCNDYGWGIDCDGNYITVAMNAEGTLSIDDIEIIAAPSQDPVIMELVDVDNDQGKQMILSWHPGDLIDLPYFTEFSVYRYSPDPSDFGTSPNGVFYGEYFSSPGTGVSPDFGELILTREDSLININFDQNPIPVNDDFQVRWSGDIYAPVAGNYNFRTHSDDGVRLFIDGVLVIDRWYDFPPTSYSGSIELDAGQHSLVLEYYENGGGAVCNLYWTPPGQGESLVSPVGTSVSVSDLGTWDYLNTIPWVGHEPYATLVNTIEDEIPTAFRVTAHTDDMNLFFHSEPAFGNSYDNIAPPPPNGLVANVSETTVSLNWNPSNVEDFNYYSVHRALDSLFQPNLSNFIGYSSTPMYTDETAPWNIPIYYKVSATDMGGNLGPGSGSASAHIFVNRAPEMFDVAISPAVPMEGDDITVSYTFFDPDGDEESGTTRAWYKNGVLTEYTGITLPSNATSCGEEWYITLTPSDGELFGPLVSSNVVTVCGVNTAPVWNDSIPEFHIAEDSQGNDFEMSGLVSDAEQATSQLVFSVTGNTNDSRVAASFDGSRLILSAISADFYGASIATLTLRANDGEVFSDTYVEVSIDPVNDSPVVTEYLGSNSFNEDESYLFEVYDFTISDPDNDAVDMTLSVLPGDNYIRSTESPGLITTAADFNGEIDVHVEILDGVGGATITIIPMMVNAVNDPAYMITTGLDVINNGSATEEQSYTITMSWKDPDGTEDATVYDVVLDGPASNWAGVTNVYSSGTGADLQYNAILTGTPDDVNLPENDISFSVVDNSEGQPVTFIEYFYIAINAVNDAPIVESYNGPMAIEEDGSLSLSIDKFNVVDVDNSPIDFSFVLYSGDNYTVGPDSATIYPDLNYNGSLSVSAMVNDGDKYAGIDFPLNVTPVNDALVLAVVYDDTVTEETSYSAAVSWSDVDGAGADSYSVMLDGSASEWVSAGPVIGSSDSLYSVVLSGTPDDENLFQNDLSITVTDQSEGEAITQNIYATISVQAVNDAPVVIEYAGYAQVDEEGDFSASINDFVVEDVDNDFPFDFSLYVVSGVNYTVSSDSSYITPVENFNGLLTVNYMVSDGGIALPFSIPVEVLPVNDDPVLEAYIGSASFDEDSNLTLSGADFSVSDPDNFTSYLNFDGQNDHLAIENPSGIPSGNDTYTLAAWVKPSSMGSRGIIGWGGYGSGNRSNALRLMGSNRIRHYWWGNDLDVTCGDLTDSWHYIVALYDGTTRKVYVDGNLLGSDTPSGHNAIVNNFRIGSTNNGEYFHGAINDVAVWNVGLTESEIQSVMSSGLSGSEEGLVAYWNFDEGSGDMVYDLTGNGNDAQLKNMEPTSWANDGYSSEYSVHIEGGQNYNVSMDGSSIIPEENYNGELNVSASVSDSEGGTSNSISFNLNVDPVNDAPAVEDLAISPSVPDFSDDLVASYIFSDIDGDTESGTVVQWYKDGVLQSSETSVTVSSTSTLCDEEWYAVITPSDGAVSGISYTSNSVTVCGENTPPEWTWSSTFRLYEDSSAVVNMYQEMIDNEQAPSQISYALLSQANPSYVSASIDGHELMLTSIVEDYSGVGVDTLVVMADDGGYQDTTTVVVNIAPVNDAPVAVDDSYSIDEGGTVVAEDETGLLSNDVDVDGDALQIMVVDEPVNGVLQVNSDLSFSYTHDGSETTSDVFTYVAYDNEYTSNVATAVISVNPVNDVPEIVYASTFETIEETPFDITLGDFVVEDPDTDIGSISLQISDGDNYTTSPITNGYTVTPTINFAGELTIPVSVSDGDTTSAVLELLVVVIGGNDAPVIVNSMDEIVVDEDADDILVSLLGSDANPYFFDQDGDNLAFAAYTSGSGLVAPLIDGDTLNISFVENAYGEDTLYVSATDVSGESVTDTVFVSVASVNDAPVIFTSAYFVTEEEDSVHVTIDDFVYADVDNDDSDLSLVLYAGEGYRVDPVTQGIFVVGYAITPDPDVVDTLYVPAAIYDGELASDLWDLMVVVLPYNDAPMVVNAAPDIFVDEDADDIFINLMGSETDPYFADSDGDSLNFDVHVSGLGVLSASVDMDMLHVSFYNNLFGFDTLFITATDPSGDSALDTILVTVASVNDAPRIVDAPSFITHEDDSLDIYTYDFVIRDEDSMEDDISIDVAGFVNNYSLDFDGSDDEVKVDGTGFISGNDPRSISVWAAGLNGNIVSLGDGLNTNKRFSILVTDNGSVLIIGENNDWGTGYSLPSDQMTHLVVTHDGTTVKLYANGEFIAEANRDYNTDATMPIMIGTNTDNRNDEYFNGTIDEVSIWSAALTAEDIQVLYQNPVPWVDVSGGQSLVAHWNFNEGSGNMVYDTSPNEHHGMINGATWQQDGETLRDDFAIIPIDFGFRLIPNENFFGDIPLVITAFDGISHSDPYFTMLTVLPMNDIVEIITPLADIEVEEDSEPISISLIGTETAPYFVDVDGDSIEFAIDVTGSDAFEIVIEGDNMEIVFVEDGNGIDTVHISATDGSGTFVVDTVVVAVMAVNDAPTTFSLLSPADSAEVIITAASVAQNATIDVSWNASEDADGDTIGYGFVLFNGSYSIQTEALYVVDVEFTELSIPHSAAVALLEVAGYQSLTCDWLVFATDGQDTTASSGLRTLTIDARPVLSVDEAAIPEVFALHQNYPNPFNPTTTIKYDLPEARNVEVMIYDIMGRKVRTLINEYQDVGYRSIRWDATDDYGRGVSAGMYIFTIQAGDFRQVRKMILLK